jgi:squalene synthase HpnC
MNAARLDPHTPTMELLGRYGPASAVADAPTSEESLGYVRGLARTHYENFTVLSRLVPERLRDDFAAVYAFCRWSDDLADETGATAEARAKSLELLRWWRAELDACFRGGETRHPVFIALRATAERHRETLAARPFHRLIDAFEQDQRVTRYETWEQVLGYCDGSANPVGRIVLALGGYADTPEHAERFRLSDCTCTALQLINFWQDVRRDLLDRDRVYIPSKETGITAEMLQDWVNRGHDPQARVPYIRGVRPLVERTAAMFAEGAALPSMLRADIAPVVRLLGSGGMAVLRSVERAGCATLWTRPKLGKAMALWLVARAWMGSRRARGQEAAL